MKKQIEQVKEFHRAFGVPILTEPTIPNLDRCALRYDLQYEELDEFETDYLNHDIVGVVDAIVDQLYILLGTAHEFGVAHLLEECFDEVHRSNMSKLDKDGKAIYRSDGKIMKSELFTAPNLKQIIESN